MTPEQLCVELACPPETPAGGLLAAWERRRTELDEALASGAHPRPVKLRLREERRRLDEAEVLASDLRRAAEIDAFLAELAREQESAAPVGAVLRLCLEKARPLVAQLGDANLRFAYERRLAAADSALAARPEPVPARAGILAPAAATASRSPLLELIPQPAGETLRRPLPRIRFVTTDAFTLGRQSTADYPLRYALDTEENRRRLTTISRVHTRLLARGGRIFVADGPSRNGTIIDEQRLDSAEPLALNFASERRFILGQFGFEVRVQYFPEGFVRFLPPPSADRSLLPIWLLETATIGSAAGSAVRLDPPVPPLAARIAFSSRGFTLEIPDQKNHVAGATLDGRVLSPGASTQMKSEQVLAFGPVSFRVVIA